MEKNKIAAYIRVSSPKQEEDGYSLNTQEINIRSYIKANPKIFSNPNIDLYKEVKSATKTKSNNITSDFDIMEGLNSRPELKELIDSIGLGKYKHLIVYTRDRLARNMGQFLALKQYFIKHGVTLYFSRAGEDFNLADDKYNRLLEIILASFAELESQTISTRVRSGCLTRIDENSRPGARIPYGFNAMKINKINTLTPIANEMKNVHRIYELYVNGGYGFRKITEMLNKEQDTFFWTKSKVESIVKNEIYTGKTNWGKRSKKCDKTSTPILKVLKLHNDPIHLSSNTWNTATQMRNLKSQVKDPHYFFTSYLLKGKLYYYDHHTLSTIEMKTRDYGNGLLVYRAEKNKEVKASPVENEKENTASIKGNKKEKKEYYTFNKDILDEAVIQQIGALFSPGFKLQIWNLLKNKCAELEENYRKSLVEFAKSIKELTEYTTDLEKLLKQNLDYRIQDRIEEQIVCSKHENLSINYEMSQIETELSRLNISEYDFNNNMSRLISSFSNSSNISRRMFIYLAVDRVYVSESNGMLSLKIQFNFP